MVVYIRKFLLTIFICSLLLLLGCADRDLLASKDAEINELTDEITALKNENKELKEKIRSQENELKDLYYKDSYEYLEIEKKAFYEKYPLLNMERWDKIIISQEWDEHQVTITDPQIIKDVGIYIFGGINYNEVEGLGSPIPSDVPKYQYTLVKGNQEQLIEVYSRDIVKIDEKYYFTNPVHILGDAFFTPPPYINIDNTPIFTKLAYSGYLHGTVQYNFGIFSKARNIGTIYPLTHDAKQLSQKPMEKYDLYETLYFYFYGEKITVNIFTEKYVQVIDQSNEYWYELDDPTSVGKFLTAG